MAGRSTDASAALRLLHGLENGGLATAEARVIASDLDPVLVHLIVRFLREAYPAGVPAARPVLERLVALTNAAPEVVAHAKSGESDPIVQWFVAEHELSSFRNRGADWIPLVVDKLES